MIRNSDNDIGAYHVGDSPDDRTMSTLEDNGITDYNHAARKVGKLTMKPVYLPAIVKAN